MQSAELLMDIKEEQGAARPTQVQPPLAVWEQFFGVRGDGFQRPTFRLINKLVASAPEQRKVVKHHHNLTLEITGARPRSILRMRRIGHNSFEYWVYAPRSQGYKHCNWLLSLLSTAVGERRWALIGKPT